VLDHLEGGTIALLRGLVLGVVVVASDTVVVVDVL
jgi:hypothetical protein